MSGVDLLGKVICHGGKVCVAALGQDRDARALLASGLIRDAGVVSSVVCMDCENAHAAEVIFDEGEYGHYCPDLGFVKLERPDIVAVEPDLSALCSIGRTTLYAALSSGDLKSVKIGTRRLITQEALRDWLNLGHSDVLTTLRSYGQISRERQRALITGESGDDVFED